MTSKEFIEKWYECYKLAFKIGLPKCRGEPTISRNNVIHIANCAMMKLKEGENE